MQFTVDAWRARAGRKLGQIKAWLDRRRREDAPYLVYGTVAGLSLWPLVEAAATSGQLAPVVGALYSLGAGVGANLVASQIEAWQNQAEAPTEEAVARWVAQNVAGNPDLRDTLDAILEAVDALAVVQQALPADEQRRFLLELRREMAQLGNADRFRAMLTGSGAIAQGPGATAVGERGVNVGGDVSGPIITGDNVTVYGRGAGSGPAGDADVVALPADLARRLHNLLLTCGPFDSDSQLKAVFIDDRIAQWGADLPQVASRGGRASALLDYLLPRANRAGANALVLFLQVLQGRHHPQDSCYGRLEQMAGELRRALS